MNKLHIIPVNDYIDHDTSTESGDDCVCVPTPQFVDGGELIVHHSLDGRELHEQTR